MRTRYLHWTWWIVNATKQQLHTYPPKRSMYKLVDTNHAYKDTNRWVPTTKDKCELIIIRAWDENPKKIQHGELRMEKKRRQPSSTTRMMLPSTSRTHTGYEKSLSVRYPNATRDRVKNQHGGATCLMGQM